MVEVATSSNMVPRTLAMADLLKVVTQLRQECPIYRKMAEMGCNPDDGWVMFIPECAKEWQIGAPGYVVYSPHISEAICFNIRRAMEHEHPFGI